jgi:aminocarboxymuconate-semialdehyde decarboxylase
MLDDKQAEPPRGDALRHGAIGARTNPEAIDVHSHAMPRPLLEEFARDGHADLSDANQGILRLAPDVCGLKAGAPIPFPPEQYDVDARLAAMDEQGVDIHVVSAPPFLFAASAPDDTFALDLVRRSNEALAAYVAQAPGRLVGLGTVPVGRPGAAEVAFFCLDSLGLAGVTLGSAGGGRELDDPLNEELWAVLAEREVLALLHPSGASSPARLADYHLFQLLGYPLETTLAVARLIFGGVLDRHRLMLCLAHGGGGLASLAGRLDLGWERKAAARTTTEPPSAYLRRLWYDTAVFETRVLRRLVADMGSERILLGTDAPFDLADRDPRGTVAALGLHAGDEAAILGRNARRLLRLR